MKRHNLGLAVMGKDSVKGFTLVELLVVIAIIAVLATIILPGMGKIRFDAKMLKCSKNLTGLYQGMLMYENQYKSYPKDDDKNTLKGIAFWNALRGKPDRDNSIFGSKRDEMYICPIKGGNASETNCDYRGPKFAVSEALKESDPIGADIPENHNPTGNYTVEINVLYWGGNTSKIKYSENSQEWTNVNDLLTTE